GEADTGCERGRGAGDCDDAAAPAGAEVPTADDVDGGPLRVEICRGVRETAAQKRGESPRRPAAMARCGAVAPDALTRCRPKADGTGCAPSVRAPAGKSGWCERRRHWSTCPYQSVTL